MSFLNSVDNLFTLIQSSTIFNGLQFAASFFNTTLVIMFAILDSIPYTNCTALVLFSSVIYFSMQVIATGIAIMRGTVIFGSLRVISYVRYILWVSLGISMILVMMSVVLLNVSYSADGICQNHFDRRWNDSGKIGLALVYCGVLGCFLIPLKKHHESITSNGGVSRDHVAKLETAAFRLTFKIVLAILGYIFTSILSFSGVFGSYFYIQFCIQNYCCVMASTWSCEVDVDSEKRLYMDSPRSSLPQNLVIYGPSAEGL
ncbi:hypothetical protein BDV3_003667 [Batrachochytrium dendrobatidis]